MKEEDPGTSGDMNSNDFRKYGHELVDWIANYLESMEDFPVLSRSLPGEIKGQLPPTPPEKGESMDQILDDFRRIILPGITHWNHPAFFAYFSITGSAPGILGELLCSALNVNAMLWKTSPAATELEEVSIDWLRQLLGLPDGLWGIFYDTASISTLHAMAAARESAEGLDVREKGLAGQPVRPTVYLSDQAHSSVEKAALTLGIGNEGIRKIPSDTEFRMIPEILLETVREDRQAGWKPLCVVATVGTTSTTSVDPVARIAEICDQEKLWLHVDAAYAGITAILPEMRWVAEGWERVDSLVTNPHKWLFTPLDLSVLFCRRPEVLRRSFSLVPEYLKTSVDDTVTNYMDYGVQLGRRFRALKLWMVLRYFGRSGISRRIREQLQWAADFAERVDSSSRFERMAPTPFSVICFRARPRTVEPSTENLERFNTALLEKVNATGEVFLSHTKLNGEFTLRLAIGNIKTTPRHIERAWVLLDQVCESLESNWDAS